MIFSIVLLLACASSAIGQSANFKEVGHYGTFFGSRKTYYLNQVDLVRYHFLM